MEKLTQHEVSIELNGERFVGHYSLVRKGRWDRLTVWYHGRSLSEPEIAHVADFWSTESLAEGLLRQLVENENAGNLP